MPIDNASGRSRGDGWFGLTVVHVVVEGSMRAYVVIIFQAGFENAPHLPFNECDHSIQAFSLD